MTFSITVIYMKAEGQVQVNEQLVCSTVEMFSTTKGVSQFNCAPLLPPLAKNMKNMNCLNSCNGEREFI